MQTSGRIALRLAMPPETANWLPDTEGYDEGALSKSSSSADHFLHGDSKFFH
jgi:hypothetical protein